MKKPCTAFKAFRKLIGSGLTPCSILVKAISRRTSSCTRKSERIFYFMPIGAFTRQIFFALKHADFEVPKTKFYPPTSVIQKRDVFRCVLFRMGQRGGKLCRILVAVDSVFNNTND